MLAALAGLFVAGDVRGLLAGGAELGCLGLDAGAVVTTLRRGGSNALLVLTALLAWLLSGSGGLAGRGSKGQVRSGRPTRCRPSTGARRRRSGAAACGGGGEAHHPDRDHDPGDRGSGAHLLRRRGPDAGFAELVQSGEQDPADDDHDEPEGQEHHRHRGEPGRFDGEEDTADDPGEADDREERALQTLL
ncbi:hypothetical protein FK530_08470 [Tsukamurella conjunctivitidis]|uniref:Uncharacterized protein n=1 Tax=Tsukamurella conjunctivitidis TaxID=2592068 RepID=A0A5C5S388_9ACTN|nr:hypothetical protein FK530_08470 [Tsukamurella conjunctivitidis]